jgi:hypothetical protein
MDDAAASVHVVEAEEDLLCDLTNELHRHALILMALYEAQEIFAENLEYHADVSSVWTDMAEVIEKGDDMRSAWMSLRRGKLRVWVRGGGLHWGR